MKTVTGGKTQTEWGKATICVISEPFFLLQKAFWKLCVESQVILCMWDKMSDKVIKNVFVINPLV